MRTLIGYEMKKILMKKSTVVTFLILFVLQLFLSISGSLGSTYVNDVFYETHAERNRIDREHGIAMSSTAVDDELLAEMQEAYAKLDWSTKEYMWTDTYKNEVRQYEDLLAHFKAWGLGKAVASGSLTEETWNAWRKETIEEMQESYELTEQEKEYWREKDEALEKPFTYEYALGYEQMVGMQGNYMTCMLLTFFIGISMVTVFADEHIRKTDQLLLCARHGRTKLYAAKLVAGSGVVFVVNLIFSLMLIAGHFYSYGAEGFDASIQFALAPWYSYSMTIGQALLISIGVLLLSSVLVAIFAMLLAEVLRSSIGAMAIIIGLLFAARLIPMPTSIRVLSQGWNLLPINLLKVDQGFLDLRLVNLFGLQLTNWQFAPILYVVLIALMVLVGARVYRSYQVSGR